MRNEDTAAIAVRAALITAGQPKRAGRVVVGEGADGAVGNGEGMAGKVIGMRRHCRQLGFGWGSEGGQSA
ncbi:MAG: hypothetical protein WBV46_08885 [Terriglobales bacterium]